MDYDLLIIGVDPEGVQRAIAAAQQGNRVAIVEGAPTTPSLEVLDRAAATVVEQGDISIKAWRDEVRRLSARIATTDRAEAERFEIDWLPGQCRFVTSNCVQVACAGVERAICSRKFVVAVNTASWCPRSFYRDERFVLSIESLLNLEQIPSSMIIVGAGTVGLAAAKTLAGLGVEVIVVDEDHRSTGLCDLIASSVRASRTSEIAYRLGDEVIGTELRRDMQAAVRLANGRILSADTVMLCVGRQGMTSDLGLDIPGVGVDERGRIWCDDSGQTWADHVSAIGHVKVTQRRSRRLESDLLRANSSFSKSFSTSAKGVEVPIGFNGA